MTNSAVIENLAVIYACTGENEQACNQFALGITNLSRRSYGQLCLHPFWHSLRGDPGFEKIVAVPSPKWPCDAESCGCVCWAFRMGRWGPSRAAG